MDPRPATRQFDRRQFARAASSGLALFAIPGWFAACARTGSSATAQPEAGDRPRLVLHVAEDSERRRQLGEGLGLFLMHGDDAELAWLAACDIECATTRELDGRGFDLERVHAVLFVPGESPIVALEGSFPFHDLYAAPEGEPTPEWNNELLDQRLRTRIDANNAWIAAQLAKALGPGSRAFELGCARERERQGDMQAGQRPSFECALSTPFLSFAQAARHPQQGVEWNGALASVVRDRWSVISPKGSSWATNHGCVEVLEKPLREEQFSTKCGMGHVPPIAQRFLHLFSTEELAGG